MKVGKEDVKGVASVGVEDVGIGRGAGQEVEGFLEFMFENAEMEGTPVFLGDDVGVD